MPRSATRLAPAKKRRGFIARKVIPFDVRDEYASLCGQRTEERLNTGPLPISIASEAPRMVQRDGSAANRSAIAQILEATQLTDFVSTEGGKRLCCG